MISHLGPCPHPSKHVLAGCVCDWCTSRREQRRISYAYKHRDDQHYASPEQVAQVRERLEGWREMGLSYRQIGAHAGVADSFVYWLLTGKKGMRTDSYEKIMAVPGRVDVAVLQGLRAGGRLTDPTGFIRRTTALSAIGFSFRWQGEQLGRASLQPYLTSVVAGEKAHRGITSGVHRDMELLYDAFSDRVAEDYGIRRATTQRLRAEASRKGWAPPVCWDFETIDDPEAIPDLTGICGSQAGYSAHRRYGIPICDACRKANTESKKEL